MKKLAIMSHGLSANGIDTFVTNVAKAVDKEKFDVSVILALDEDNHQIREDEVAAAGVKIFRTCDLGSMKRMFTHVVRLYRILKTEKPDVFHANMDLLNGFNLFAAWAAGVPVRVCHSHTSASQYVLKNGKSFVVSCYHFVMRTCCRLFSNCRCGCSAVAMEYLYGAKWAKMKNTHIINNGVDIKRFSAKTGTSGTEDHKIVTVGRMTQGKNPFFALEIIEQLSKIRQDFEYLWVGNGDLMDAVRTKIEEKGLQEHVKLLGVRSDVDAVLADCDVFLLPSLFEGLPVSLVEAQAAGLPCLITDTITREVNCGGCLYESLNSSPSRWAQILSDLLDGKITFSIDVEKLETFDTTYMIKQLEEVYST